MASIWANLDSQKMVHAFNVATKQPVMKHNDILYTVSINDQDRYEIFLNFKSVKTVDEFGTAEHEINVSHHTWWYESIDLFKQNKIERGWDVLRLKQLADGGIPAVDWQTKNMGEVAELSSTVLLAWYEDPEDSPWHTNDDTGVSGLAPSFEHIQAILFRSHAIGLKTIIEQLIGGVCLL